MELLRSEHNEEIEKQNQVLDDVTKPTNLLGMNWIYAKISFLKWEKKLGQNIRIFGLDRFRDIEPKGFLNKICTNIQYLKLFIKANFPIM